MAKAALSAVSRGTPAKLSLEMVLDAAAGQAFKASPLLKVCVGPSTKAAAANRSSNKPRANREEVAAWPRLAAAVVAAAAESVRRSGVFKGAAPPPLAVAAGEMAGVVASQREPVEAWTLVEHPESGEVAA